jgi:hypothetical protein
MQQHLRFRHQPLPEAFILTDGQIAINAASLYRFGFGRQHALPVRTADTPQAGGDVPRFELFVCKVCAQGIEQRPAFMVIQIQLQQRLEYQTVTINRKMDRLGADPKGGANRAWGIPACSHWGIGQQRSGRPVTVALDAMGGACPCADTAMRRGRHVTTRQDGFEGWVASASTS